MPEVWKITLRRSMGATEVLVMAPAPAPARNWRSILCDPRRSNRQRGEVGRWGGGKLGHVWEGLSLVRDVINAAARLLGARQRQSASGKARVGSVW
jgi:hypothetical protein